MIHRVATRTISINDNAFDAIYDMHMRMVAQENKRNNAEQAISHLRAAIQLCDEELCSDSEYKKFEAYCGLLEQHSKLKKWNECLALIDKIRQIVEAYGDEKVLDAGMKIIGYYGEEAREALGLRSQEEKNEFFSFRRSLALYSRVKTELKDVPCGEEDLPETFDVGSFDTDKGSGARIIQGILDSTNALIAEAKDTVSPDAVTGATALYYRAMAAEHSNTDAAIALAKQALEKTSYMHGAYIVLGEAYVKKGDYSELNKIAKKIIDQTKLKGHGYFYQALVNAKWQKFDETRKAIYAGVAYDVSAGRYASRHAPRIINALIECEQANPKFKKPDDINKKLISLIQQAQTHFKNQKYKIVWQLLVEAIALSPTNPELYANLAYVIFMINPLAPEATNAINIAIWFCNTGNCEFDDSQFLNDKYRLFLDKLAKPAVSASNPVKLLADSGANIEKKAEEKTASTIIPQDEYKQALVEKDWKKCEELFATCKKACEQQLAISPVVVYYSLAFAYRAKVDYLTLQKKYNDALEALTSALKFYAKYVENTPIEEINLLSQLHFYNSLNESFNKIPISKAGSIITIDPSVQPASIENTIKFAMEMGKINDQEAYIKKLTLMMYGFDEKSSTERSESEIIKIRKAALYFLRAKEKSLLAKNKNDFVGVVDLCKKALLICSSNLDPLILMVQTFLRNEDWEAAHQYLLLVMRRMATSEGAEARKDMFSYFVVCDSNLPGNEASKSNEIPEMKGISRMASLIKKARGNMLKGRFEEARIDLLKVMQSMPSDQPFPIQVLVDLAFVNNMLGKSDVASNYLVVSEFVNSKDSMKKASDPERDFEWARHEWNESMRALASGDKVISNISFLRVIHGYLMERKHAMFPLSSEAETTAGAGTTAKVKPKVKLKVKRKAKLNSERAKKLEHALTAYIDSDRYSLSSAFSPSKLNDFLPETFDWMIKKLESIYVEEIEFYNQVTANQKAREDKAAAKETSSQQAAELAAAPSQQVAEPVTTVPSQQSTDSNTTVPIPTSESAVVVVPAGSPTSDVSPTPTPSTKPAPKFKMQERRRRAKPQAIVKEKPSDEKPDESALSKPDDEKVDTSAPSKTISEGGDASSKSSDTDDASKQNKQIDVAASSRNAKVKERRQRKHQELLERRQKKTKTLAASSTTKTPPSLSAKVSPASTVETPLPSRVVISLPSIAKTPSPLTTEKSSLSTAKIPSPLMIETPLSSTASTPTSSVSASSTPDVATPSPVTPLTSLSKVSKPSPDSKKTISGSSLKIKLRLGAPEFVPASEQKLAPEQKYILASSDPIRAAAWASIEPKIKNYKIARTIKLPPQSALCLWKLSATQPCFGVGGQVRDPLRGRENADGDQMCGHSFAQLQAALGKDFSSWQSAQSNLFIALPNSKIMRRSGKPIAIKRRHFLANESQSADPLFQDAISRDFTFNTVVARIVKFDPVTFDNECEVYSPLGRRAVDDLDNGYIRFNKKFHAYVRSEINDIRLLLRAIDYSNRGFILPPETIQDMRFILEEFNLTDLNPQIPADEKSQIAAANEVAMTNGVLKKLFVDCSVTQTFANLRNMFDFDVLEKMYPPLHACLAKNAEWRESLFEYVSTLGKRSLEEMYALFIIVTPKTSEWEANPLFAPMKDKIFEVQPKVLASWNDFLKMKKTIAAEAQATGKAPVPR